MHLSWCVPCDDWMCIPRPCSSLAPWQHLSWSTSKACSLRLRGAPAQVQAKSTLPLQGKYVVLFFYPLDFTFVCPTEITAFSDRHGDFEKVNAEVGLNWQHGVLSTVLLAGSAVVLYLAPC